MNNFDPLKIYLNEIYKIKLLTIEDEKRLGKIIKQGRLKLKKLGEKYGWTLSELLNRDIKKKKWMSNVKFESLLNQLDLIFDEIETAKNEFIKSNLRLVVDIARQYENRNVPLIDLIDEGNLGLIASVDRFDYEKGVKFSTYAKWWIERYIDEFISTRNRFIKLPYWIERLVKKYSIVSRQMTAELGYNPSIKQIATKMQIPINRLIEIIRISQEPISLEDIESLETKEQMTNLVEDKRTISPIEAVFMISLHEIIERLIIKLRLNEQIVIRLRYGLTEKGECSLSEISKLLGVSREQVRQIQKRALSKLNILSKKEKIENFLYS